MIGWLINLGEEQERKTAIEQAAIRCDVPRQAMEKDWWITLTLKVDLFFCLRVWLLCSGLVFELILRIAAYMEYSEYNHFAF